LYTIIFNFIPKESTDYDMPTPWTVTNRIGHPEEKGEGKARKRKKAGGRGIQAITMYNFKFADI